MILTSYCTLGHQTLLVYKFQTCTSYGFQDTGIQTEEEQQRQQQEELEKLTFCHISHVNGPIQTKFLIDIHIDLGYNPAVSKVDYN